jgi:hypothetical protein
MTATVSFGVIMRLSLPLLLLLVAATEAFQAPSGTVRKNNNALDVRSSTCRQAIPVYSKFLGRFRKKKKVEQVPEIQMGDSITDVDVEQMMVEEDGTVHHEAVSIRDVLGQDKAILVGAYTIGCTPSAVLNLGRFL